MSLKNPPGIDPGTVRLVAQCINHYATPGPPLQGVQKQKSLNKKSTEERPSVVNGSLKTSKEILLPLQGLGQSDNLAPLQIDILKLS